MSTAAVTPFRSFVQTPIFSVSRLGTRVTLSCVTGFHGSRVAEMVPPVHWVALTLHACFEHQLSHQLHTNYRRCPCHRQYDAHGDWTGTNMRLGMSSSRIENYCQTETARACTGSSPHPLGGYHEFADCARTRNGVCALINKLLTCWCTVTHGKCDYEDTACTHVRFFAQNLLISIHPVSFMITLASCSNIVLNI